MSGKTPGFKKGNPGGPGRPKREVERSYLESLKESVSLTQWKKIAKRAVDDAMQGDAKARDWLSKYLIGDKPLIAITMTDPMSDVSYAGGDRIRELIASLDAEDAEHGES
jgi:uncharacterized protein (DUF2384 family)